MISLGDKENTGQSPRTILLTSTLGRRGTMVSPAYSMCIQEVPNEKGTGSDVFQSCWKPNGEDRHGYLGTATNYKVRQQIHPGSLRLRQHDRKDTG